MGEQPSYYAIIPANVRYDSELNANAKLLYGEISTLSNKFGFCVATNEYFSNLYNVSTRTITDWIKLLEDKGYLKSEITTKRYEDGTIKKVRKIYIDHIEVSQQNHIEVSRNNHIEENFSYNNTSNINNINKKEIYKEKERFKKPTLEEVEEYCKERGNSVNPSTFIDFYESKGWKVGKSPMKDWKASIRLWESKSKKESNTPIWFNEPYSNQASENDEKEMEELLSDIRDII